MKEQINNNFQENKINLLNQLILKLDEVNEHWINIDDSSGLIGENAESYGMDEGDVRNLENLIVGELASIDFNKDDLSENNLVIINKYLSVGDNGDLKHKIANKLGIVYRGPFEENPTHSSLGAKQIIKEIDKEDKLN